KYKQYREKQASLSKEFQTVNNQELSIFQDIIKGVSQKLAKEEGYGLIMQAEGVVYYDESYNITSKILTRLKADLPKK
ncbi:MAG: OmpH family outer membrane protein, partial [Gammaproteobacteria bacterium]|nr:OmpH family outer membrane protein [Gammaproteobacteria bacterium]